MKQLFKYIAVFILFFTVFLGWHSLINDFLGTDPYYHSKHSYLMLENKDFTLVEAWSKFHFLENAPVDLWWAYHLAQAGLIYFFSIIWGTKVLTAISASFVFTFFYFVLNKFKISRPFVWTTLLLFSSVSFTSRMLLERPLIGSVALALLGYYFIAKKKYVSLFILTIFFALYHQMCLMILIPLFFYYLAEFYIDKQIDLKLAVASLGGLLFGIILHPNALNYINTLYITYWQIFYLKFSGVNLSIGSELQTFFLSHLIDDNLVLFIFFIFTLALFFKELLEKKIKDKILLSLFLISLFWFLVSILIIRGVEYWAPFGLLFIAVAFDRIKKTNDYEIAGKFIKDRIKPRIVLFFISAVVILFLINNALNIFFMINGVNKNNKNIYFKEANDWLISNTEKGETIFYPIWSMFPRMFFYNNHNNYLTAFDPTFFYEYNPKTYYIWNNISQHGVYCDKEWPCLDISARNEIKILKKALVIVLNSKYILLQNNNSKLYRTLGFRNRDFFKVYENKELAIFKIVD